MSEKLHPEGSSAIEQRPELAKYIERLANSPLGWPQDDWCNFLEELNRALSSNARERALEEAHERGREAGLLEARQICQDWATSYENRIKQGIAEVEYKRSADACVLSIDMRIFHNRVDIADAKSRAAISGNELKSIRNECRALRTPDVERPGEPKK